MKNTRKFKSETISGRELSVHLPNLVICIKTKGGSAQLKLEEGNCISSQRWWINNIQVFQMEDTYTAINKMGAIINEINTIGDDAIEKWNYKD